VSVTLPVDAATRGLVVDDREEAAPGGSEHILLVEDEALVRRFDARTLRALGYRVTEAADGAQALTAFAARRDDVDHLITDVVMPHMSGPELVNRISTLEPRITVIYISGYADDAVLRRGILGNAGHFLQKPITAALLARIVREALDACS
jgi:CheY-like chemotaxis protein